MTEQDAANERDTVGEQGVAEGQLAAPPTTGNPAVDEALATAVGPQLDPAGMLARLTGAHEHLARILETSREDVQAPIPGVPAGEG